MRSEERSGVIFIVMLFIWGTLITEPFHIFVRYITKTTDLIFGKMGTGIHTGLGNIFLLAFLLILTIVLLKISSTVFAIYIPGLMSVLTLTGFLIRSVSKHMVKVGDAVALLTIIVIVCFLYFMRMDNILLWIGDLFIFSIPMYVITGLIFIPLAKMGSVIDTILYITNFQEHDLTRFYDGVIKIPGIVWGIFIAILWVLPVIYFSFGRKGKNNE